MDLGRTVVFFLLLGCLHLTRAFVGVIAPGKIRLGTEQKILLLGVGLNSEERVFQLTLHPRNNPTATFLRRQVRVENGILKTVSFQVEPGDIVPSTSSKLTLQVRNTRAVNNGFNRQVHIVIDKRPGYLFVQLDKPIYTPRQTVTYRVIAVDESLSWAPWPVQVSLLNPDDHLIDRVTKSARDVFKGDEFLLSKNPVLGEWKVRASYTNFSTDSVVKFDVREYVLPKFGVRVTSSIQSLFAGESDPFTLRVKAEYNYRKPVNGSVILNIIAKTEHTEMVVIPNMRGHLDASGQLELPVDFEELKDHDIVRYLDYCDIYVSVNVTDVTSREVVSEEYRVAAYSSSRFRLETNHRKYFQPGLPYPLKVLVKTIYGTPAANVVLEIEVNGVVTRNTTNRKGLVSGVYYPPADDLLFVIKIRPQGYEQDEELLELISMNTDNANVITVSAPALPPLNSDLRVDVRYRNSPGAYFMIVSSRGQIILQEKYAAEGDGHDVRTISRQHLKDMVPSARILVFFVASQQIYADSVYLPMRQSCQEEVQMRVLGSRESYKPKEHLVFQVNGGGQMDVGLVAVDKAVYQIKLDKSVTRKTMFAGLEAHDMGSGVGDGANVKKVFEAAGFQLMIMNDFPEWGFRLHGGVEDLVAPKAAPKENDLLRSYFPESWLFQEIKLSPAGRHTVNVTLPDSLTTWVMYAVGVSADRGICVSKKTQVLVQKKFFVEIHFPYHTVRLEEVEIRVTVSNYLGYSTQVFLTTSAYGLCVPSVDGEVKEFPSFQLAHGQTVMRTFTVLPIKAGKYAIRAEVETPNAVETDYVERYLFVKSEGEPNHKTINFNLDPTGEPRNDLTVKQSMTRHGQNTTVDMAFPMDAIPESEKIHITAAGDLLGDMISNIILSNDLPSDDDGVEMLMMDLAPSIYGLKYLEQLDMLSPSVLDKGRRHIRHGLAQVLKYRNSEGAFCLEYNEPDAEDNPFISTWFTAFVLKTLCAAKHIVALDPAITEQGYSWLLRQIQGQGSNFRIHEENPQIVEDSPDAAKSLAAEILISSHSCSYPITGELMAKRNALVRYVRQRQRRPLRRLTQAKVTHSLMVSRPNQRYWRSFANILRRMKRQTADGLIYWSEETDESSSEPLLQSDGPSQEGIEATAYSLMVFVSVNVQFRCYNPRRRRRNPCRQLYVDPDKIADWLIKWRDGSGLFNYATDTAAATEALAKYRQAKTIPITDLRLNMRTSPNDTFTRRLTFTEEDALIPKSMSDVPIGQHLYVKTSGSGLGQMHVETNYNLPVDVNANCRFDMNVHQLYPPDYSSITDGSSMSMGLCDVCGSDFTCPKGDDFVCKSQSQPDGGLGHSVQTYCLKICLQYHGDNNHGRTDVQVRMLSGFIPSDCDLREMKGGRVVAASYNNDKNAVEIRLRSVSATDLECFGFRVLRAQTVLRVRPATVSLKSFNVDEWTCPRTYTSVDNTVSLPVFCANQRHNQMRDCSCMNDHCVRCSPGVDQVGINYLQTKITPSKFAFKLSARSKEEVNGFQHLTFYVNEDVKQCGGDMSRREVTFVTKGECGCPIFQPGALYWVIGSDVLRHIDQEGNTKYKYFLNGNTFLAYNGGTTDFRRVSSFIRNVITSEQVTRCPDS